MSKPANKPYPKAPMIDNDLNIVKTHPKEKNIVLHDNPKATYTNVTTYDQSLNISKNFWNEILVHHERKYRRTEILRQFARFFNDFEFFPVMYQGSSITDRFYIRLSKQEVDVLFANGLKIIMTDGKPLPLTIHINVAEYFDGQICARKRIQTVLEKQRTHPERYANKYMCLNLNNFHDKPQIKDTIFLCLANEATLNLVCESILKYTDLCRDLQNNRINGIKISNNCIKILTPFAKLKGINLKFLDLSANDVESVDQMECLRDFQLERLNVAANPVSGVRTFQHRIRTIIPALQNLDGKEFMVKVKKEPGELTTSPTKPGSDAQLALRQLPPPTQQQSKQQNKSSNSGPLSMDSVSAHDFNPNFDLAKFRASQSWHKITVEHDGKSSKAELLKALYKLVDNTDFYPTFYKENATSDLFFLRQCTDALSIFIRNQMYLNVGEQSFAMSLQMNAVPYQRGDADPPNAIIEAISERFNFMDKSLNLERFSESSHFKDIIINLGNTKVLNLVLTMCGRKFGAMAVSINLRNNGIVSSNGMSPLMMMKMLRILDLGNNGIQTLKEFLEAFPSKVKMTELVFDGNPLCQLFTTSGDYIKTFKTFFPDLEKLDNIVVTKRMLISHQNYLCDVNYYDLVDNFLRKYFKIYDSVQRFYLRDFYHHSALYSMSVNYDQAKITIANSQRINRYLSRSRNMLKMANLSQSMTNLKVGCTDIMSYFVELPITEHDFHSFKIDMTIANEDMICFTINGILKEMGSNIHENELWFGFTRTFVLKETSHRLGIFKNTSQYKIVNDKVTITNLTMNQIKNGFKKKPPPADNKMTDNDDLTEIEKDIMVRMFQDITNMKTKWCHNCLERSDWVMPNAIEVFMRLYEENRIPKVGFIPMEVD